MKKNLLSLLVTNICIFSVYADANSDHSESLETIVVSGTPFSQQVGTQKITESEIKRRPTKDGNITELLKNNPNVQFSNTVDSSNNGGEISPADISIHGEKFYNNNFTIDGLSNNDNINPNGGNAPDGYDVRELPAGGTQSFWLNTNLLKKVEVFDSNISAKYGHFTGGVVDGELKDPALDRSSGRIYYRTTRDTWTKFHIDDSEREEWEKAEQLTYQPEFTKHQFGIEVNQPLTSKAALLFAYDRSQSSIPTHHSYLGNWDKQTRRNETYMLKGIYTPDNGDLWKATLIYSPHSGKYVKYNIKDGAFKTTGGGFQAALEWDTEFSWAKLKSYLSYKQTGNTIKHDGSNFYQYNNMFGDFNWCSEGDALGCIYASEGGFGRYKTKKETITFKQNFNAKSFNTGDIEHNIDFGWELDFASAKYDRDTEVYSYTNGRKNTAASVTFRNYTYFPARHVKVRDDTYALYVQDRASWKNLEITAGARLDYDEYLGNTNIAPRFSLSYDVFSDQSTRLFGGLNRYYAGTMLAYKLRNAIGTVSSYKLNTKTGLYTQTNANSGINYDVSDLKTPYSDEVSLGIAQKFYNTLWTFKWVNRHGKDQFTLANDNTLNNDGRSKSNTFTLAVAPLTAWKTKHANIDWLFGAQISKTESNNLDYDNSVIGDGIGITKAIWENKLIDIADLPQTDFNTPWSTFLNVSTYFPSLRLNWDQRLSYTAAYSSYTRNLKMCSTAISACGNYADYVYDYKKHRYNNAFILDWRFAYKQPIIGNQFVEFTLDINNVLDKRVAVASVDGDITTRTGTGVSYKMGRNFWFGVSYNW